jgi:hypothetical protein
MSSRAYSPAEREQHRAVIASCLKSFNSASSDFILKGGTALLACYGLDRFSENIDLDAQRGKTKFFDNIQKFCEQNGYSFRNAKDTDDVKRAMINYGNDGKPLKVEVSYRRRNIPSDEITTKNGICVYDIDTLASMKINAYNQRDKIRDLYDITFIYNNYQDDLSKGTIKSLRNALEYKGLEHFDYVVNQQSDPLIDKNKLGDDFLDMYEELGLMVTEDDRQTVNSASPTKNTQNTFNAAESIAESIDKYNSGKISTQSNGFDLLAALQAGEQIAIEKSESQATMCESNPPVGTSESHLPIESIPETTAKSDENEKSGNAESSPQATESVIAENNAAIEPPKPMETKKQFKPRCPKNALVLPTTKTSTGPKLPGE